MKHLISIFSLLLLLTTQGMMANGKKTKDKKPNIIFFIADDMTRNMFNCLEEGKGKNLTPNIDFLAEEGTIMHQQHVSATVCTPSRFNVLTGKYASRAENPGFLRQSRKNNKQRVVEWNTHILPGEQNLINVLKASGYNTGAVGKNHVFEVKKYKKIPLSADASDKKVMDQQLLNYKLTIEAYHQCGFDYADGIFYENPDFNGPMDLAVHNLDWSTEAALTFLDDTDEQPFFLYFATTIPHGPQKAERAWNADRKITPIGILDKAPSCLPDKSTIPTRLKEADVKVNDPKANLLWMDDALGALIHKLKDIGEFDNTIIYFFNDHGQYAKGTIYQGSVLNPSIIWQKGGFEVGNHCEALVSNVDFMPTIIEQAGLNPKKYDYDGRSFATILEGKEQKARESHYFEIGYSRGVRMGDYKYIAVRYPQWVMDIDDEQRQTILDDYNKILAGRGKAPNNLDPQAGFGHVQIVPGGGDAEFPATQRYKHYSDADQLYNLVDDPEEQNNLFNDPKYRDLARKMQVELQKHIKTIPGGFGELKTK
ncbi:sulfatase family protein [Carboxylicivirga sp. N1Y90]|uniref:sulfatase family protein n=1 Tax=Carboxylicivirga fragile TaxID=3417571 RepID=UPI003D34A03F|nr:sulfatase-like hydrolase/transferase [Marinilabiliaceae bacterium N1Y90]